MHLCTLLAGFCAYDCIHSHAAVHINMKRPLQTDIIIWMQKMKNLTAERTNHVSLRKLQKHCLSLPGPCLVYQASSCTCLQSITHSVYTHCLVSTAPSRQSSAFLVCTWHSLPSSLPPCFLPLRPPHLLSKGRNGGESSLCNHIPSLTQHSRPGAYLKLLNSHHDDQIRKKLPGSTCPSQVPCSGALY